MPRPFTVVVAHALAMGAAWLLCGEFFRGDSGLVCLLVIYVDSFLAPIILLLLVIALLQYTTRRRSILTAIILLLAVQVANPVSGGRFIARRVAFEIRKLSDQARLAFAQDREFYAVDDTALPNRSEWKYNPAFPMRQGVTTFSDVTREYHGATVQVMSFKNPILVHLTGPVYDIDRVVLYGSAERDGRREERISLLLLFRRDILVSWCITHIWNIDFGNWQKGRLDTCPPDADYGSRELMRVTKAYFCSRGGLYRRYHGISNITDCSL